MAGVHMVHDDETGRPVHLSLPLPDLEVLARSMRNRPTQDLAHDIADRADWLHENGYEVDPYWLYGELLQDWDNVEIGQVATVLLAWLEV